MKGQRKAERKDWEWRRRVKRKGRRGRGRKGIF